MKELAGNEELKNWHLNLSSEISQFYSDPFGFVMFAYPWGEPGTPLAHFAGPDRWQREFLRELGKAIRERAFDGKNAVRPIRMAVSSGRGVGKSALVGMLSNFLMSTRPECRGTLTATSFQQLSSRTWTAVHFWNALSITQNWFQVSNEKMHHVGKPKSWFCTPQTCKEENAEGFSGQHALTSTNFYIFDEGSGVPDKIYEVAEWGMTDGEPIILVFGNPTRSEGRFYDICFGKDRDHWNVRCVDARESIFTNKQELADKIAEYGEDSDHVRVWVRGLPPSASDLQFIDRQMVWNARRREVQVLPDEPLVMGVDVARGGEDFNVLRFRRGYDAKTILPIRIPGREVRDSMMLVTKIAEVISAHKPKAVFLDATGGSIGGPIGDRVRQLGFPVIDVQFGGKAPDEHYADMRSWMWAKMRDWLQQGMIDASPHLESDLLAPTATHNKRTRLVLESKESLKARGLHSPDDGDALALTFAQPVVPDRPKAKPPQYPITVWT